MKKEKVFMWRGHPVKTVGNLTDELHGVVKRNNPSEAALFLNNYREAVGDRVAESNIGYCLGYLSKDMFVSGLRLFQVEHPIFGDAEKARRLKPRQAMELGGEVAAASAFDGDVTRTK